MSLRSALLAVMGSVAWGMGATADAQQPVSTPAVATMPADGLAGYIIGPRDLLEIRVLEAPDLNVERRVTDAGTIDLPILGDFSVAGLDAAGVRDKLEKMLMAKLMNRANVSVVVKDFENRPLSVLGAVQKPGSLSVSARWTLLEAISAAGGLTDKAGRSIYVMRRSDKGISDTLEIQVDDLLHGASARWNVPLMPGDIVNVEAKRGVRVFCLGAVRSPGALDFDGDDRLTVLSVIAKAGGLTDKASSKVRIKRRGPDGKDAEIVVNFSRVVSGKDPDVPMKADDVLIVKESFF